MADASGFTITEPAADDDDGKRGPPQRERIYDAVIRAGVCFWSDEDHAAYATVPRGAHVEKHRVRTSKSAVNNAVEADSVGVFVAIEVSGFARWRRAGR